ncbi:MAG TPA: hypothetical protein PLP58_19960, partial [Prosthecobacter sp.]|nr:hypothetical protein [Prosthecobacter sp.]
EAGDGWQRLVLRVEPRQDVREAVMALASERGWQVRELHRRLPGLEEVFVELASAESPGVF